MNIKVKTVKATAMLRCDANVWEKSWTVECIWHLSRHALNTLTTLTDESSDSVFRLRGSGDVGSKHYFIFLDMLKNVFQDLLSIFMMHLEDILTREDGDWLKMMLFSCSHHNPVSRLKYDWSEEQDMNVKLSSHQNNLNVFSSLAITFTHLQSPKDQDNADENTI